MIKNHYLAKSINDVSWGYFVQMLSYKVEKTGGQLIRVNPQNTSKICSKCKAIQDMPLSKKQFKCLSCGFVCHRDINAAMNIDRAGRARIYASRDIVRPSEMKVDVVEAGTIREPALS